MLLKPNIHNETVYLDSIDKKTIMSTVNNYFKERSAKRAKVSIEIWKKLTPGSNFLSNFLYRTSNILPVSGLDANEIIFIWQ